MREVEIESPSSMEAVNLLTLLILSIQPTCLYALVIATIFLTVQDTLTSLKRYFNNVFSDSEKQMAMNLFLGMGLSFHVHTNREVCTSHRFIIPSFPRYGRWSLTIVSTILHLAVN